MLGGDSSAGTGDLDLPPSSLIRLNPLSGVNLPTCSSIRVCRRTSIEWAACRIVTLAPLDSGSERPIAPSRPLR